MKRKAASLPMNILVVAIILLVVLVVYLAIFQGLFKKESGHINKQIDNLDDHDGDGVINLYDKCCCTNPDKIELVGVNGCPPDVKPTKSTTCSECIR
jgi:hypothetical protein